MHQKLPLFFVLFVLSNFAYAEAYRCQDAKGYFVYSASPCGGTDEAPPTPEISQPSSQAESNTPRREVYTKDLPPMQAPDGMTQACFSYVNTTARFPDPSSTKLLSSSKKWVAVKSVGGRQMVTIALTSKNEAGMYLGIKQFNCLFMGDNATINTNDYELL